MSEDAIDMKEVMERVQDDRELLIELLQIFTDDYNEKKKLLEQAVGKNDFEQIKSISHSMKGASGNIAAKKLRGSFMELEQMARDQNLTNAQALVAVIDQQFNELKDYIAKNLT